MSKKYNIVGKLLDKQNKIVGYYLKTDDGQRVFYAITEMLDLWKHDEIEINNVKVTGTGQLRGINGFKVSEVFSTKLSLTENKREVIMDILATLEYEANKIIGLSSSKSKVVHNIMYVSSYSYSVKQYTGVTKQVDLKEINKQLSSMVREKQRRFASECFVFLDSTFKLHICVRTALVGDTLYEVGNLATRYWVQVYKNAGQFKLGGNLRMNDNLVGAYFSDISFMGIPNELMLKGKIYEMREGYAIPIVVLIEYLVNIGLVYSV